MAWSAEVVTARAAPRAGRVASHALRPRGVRRPGGGALAALRRNPVNPRRTTRGKAAPTPAPAPTANAPSPPLRPAQALPMDIQDERGALTHLPQNSQTWRTACVYPDSCTVHRIGRSSVLKNYTELRSGKVGPVSRRTIADNPRSSTPTRARRAMPATRGCTAHRTSSLPSARTSAPAPRTAALAEEEGSRRGLVLLRWV